MSAVPSLRPRPTLEPELAVLAAGGGPHVAGIDEAGRGAIAGPVIAAAVILPLAAPRERPTLLAALDGVDDSKRLSPDQRERLFGVITTHAVAWAVGAASPQEIDADGILPATRAAMRRAVMTLAPAPAFLLIDGRIRLAGLAVAQQSLIRGDARSLSIAAASILAKVTRDRLMIELDRAHPGYGLARHKGYCTRQHESALARLGPSPVHRRSFAPLRPTLL